jgi:ATP-dependent protease ClpP protease subunit
MIRILLATLALCLTTSASAERKRLQVNPDRAMVIEGPIAGGNLNHLGDLLLEMDNSAPIDIVISSPGGSVVAGFIFVSKMKAAQAQGKSIRCFVPDVAASMAFQILVNCDERYVLNRSFLLWHRARVFFGGFNFAIVTAPIAKQLSVQLDILDQTIYDETAAALGAPDEYVRYHFENETLHTGASLQKSAPNFLSAHDSISGLLEALKNDKLPRTAALSPFDMRSLYRPGQIVYIRRGLID